MNAQQAFHHALQLLREGKSREAVAHCQAALHGAPEDVNLLALLGAAHISCRDPASAVPPLKKAVSLWPEFARAHEDLGIALFAVGAAQEAAKCLERAAELAPDREAVLERLAQVYLALGRGADADAVLERSFALNPRKAALAQAGQLLRERKLREAEQIAREWARRDPNDVDALRLLAKLATEAERHNAAVDIYARILRLAPDFVDAWREYALALQEAWRVEEGIEAARKAVTLAPDNPRLHALWAGLCARSGDPATAVRGYEQALALRPENPGALLGYGHVLKTMGRQAEGIKAYREAIRFRPDFGEAWWSLANLKIFRFTDADVAAMEAQVNGGRLGNEALVHFCFALGKAFEDRGDWDRAFAYYDRGNRTHRPGIDYDPAQTIADHDDIIEVFTPELFQRLAGMGDPDPAPIFIVGLPRSGSTLIEQILASHSQVEGTSELPELGRLVRVINRRGGARYPRAVRDFNGADCLALGRRYLEKTQRHRHGAPRFTDKMPNNFALVGLLHLILPNAKVINARRHPLDTCLSCYKQHFASGQSFTYDLQELGEFYLEYVRLMQHWHSVLPGRVLDVQYEDMVADQEAQTRRLLDYCGLPFEPACLRFYQTDRAVQTASSEQVRQPIYDRSIGHWRHFERQLAPLIEVLEPVVR